MKPEEWLANITMFAEQVAVYESDLRATCLDALADGVPVAEVADAAGVTRVTLWRWRQEVES